MRIFQTSNGPNQNSDHQKNFKKKSRLHVTKYECGNSLTTYTILTAHLHYWYLIMSQPQNTKALFSMVALVLTIITHSCLAYLILIEHCEERPLHVFLCQVCTCL